MPGDRKFDLGDYIEVKDRIKLLYEKYPEARVVTERAELWLDDGVPRVVVKAAVYRTPEDTLPSTGWSWMVLPGTTSYTRGSELENTETSAVGRAIGFLGIGIDKSIASANEVQNKSAAQPGDPVGEPQDGGSLIGEVVEGKSPCDLQLRQTPEGPIAGFKLKQGRAGLQVLAHGNLAAALQPFLAGLIDQRVSVWGSIQLVPWERDGKPMPPYKRLNMSKIKTAEWTLPGDVPQAQPADSGPEEDGPPDDVTLVGERPEAPTAPLFPPS